MQRGPMLSVYCPFVSFLLEELEGERTDRFPNLEVIQAEEQFVYFDSREKAGFRWASPVQTYLELASGDKKGPGDGRAGKGTNTKQSTMKSLQPLTNALADLLHELNGTDIKLIIGGGFGIYLKTTYVREHKLRTLLEIWREIQPVNRREAWKTGFESKRAMPWSNN
jgi:hypothetical protein